MKSRLLWEWMKDRPNRRHIVTWEMCGICARYPEPKPGQPCRKCWDRFFNHPPQERAA